MSRAIKDADLLESVALGNNNSTTFTDAIDLGAATPFPVTEVITVQISTTAATGANNKNVNIVIQDSNVNTNANFTNVAAVAALVIPEVGAAYAATTRNIALPPGVRQFIRLRCNTENAGGNATDGTATIRILT